jgi:hypothetical protein
VAELARLASLTRLDLENCESLGTAALAALQECCPQLQHLDLEGTGGSSPQLLRISPLSPVNAPLRADP